MTNLEIDRARQLGFSLINCESGQILWRRVRRCMTIVQVDTGEEHERDFDQETRIDFPDENDMVGNRAWAESLAAEYR